VKILFSNHSIHFFFQRHPEGVAQITFREPEEADACVTLLNGRWFGQRKITAETWDGKTKYK
jgi:HIV Tat-specific factor 1